MIGKVSSYLVQSSDSRLADYLVGIAAALDIAPEVGTTAEFIQQDALAFALDHEALELDKQAALSSLGLPGEGDWEYAEWPGITTVRDSATIGEG